MSNVLEVENIHTYIGQYHILEGVSLQVPASGITVLLGRNGAGKTTTLKSILGLTPPREGRVVFEGREIQGRRAFEIASLGIGYVPEHRAIFRDLSVAENLRIAERRPGDLERKARRIVLKYRTQLEEYVTTNPKFQSSLEPLPCPAHAP